MSSQKIKSQKIKNENILYYTNFNYLNSSNLYFLSPIYKSESMNYNYSNSLPTNPYVNANSNIYSQRNKIPQSVLHSNTTPRKQTLIRNQSFQNRIYNDDLIQLIAKIRSLEDDLINQRFKNQSLQRKLLQYQKIIDNLEYQLTTQNYQLTKYKHEIQLSNQKNLQILKYQQNLKLVGQEIQQINNVLISKNKEIDIVAERNKLLQFQIKKIDQQNHLIRVNQSILKKDMDTVLQEIDSILNDIKKQDNPKDNKQTIRKGNSQQNTQAFRMFQNLSSKQQNLTQQIVQNSRDTSLTFNYQYCGEQISKRIDIFREIFLQLASFYKTLHKQSSISKKQLLSSLMKQKQKNIIMEYENKLLEQRLQDLSKKPNILTTLQSDKKSYENFEEMLKKQDEYIIRLDQLQRENEGLKQYIAELQNGNEYAQKIEIQQKGSMIQTLKKQNNMLQCALCQYEQRLKTSEKKYLQLSNITEQQIQNEQKNSLQSNKRIRKLEQQNIELKVRLQQKQGTIRVLEKQMQIVKGQEGNIEQQNQKEDQRYEQRGSSLLNKNKNNDQLQTHRRSQ